MFSKIVISSLLVTTSAHIMLHSDQNTTVVGRAPTCYSESDFDKCLDECRTPDSGATCDSEISGVNMYWCCHNPSPGCYSNQNDAKSHCSTGKVKKVDDYNYCCQLNDCCHHDDDDCAIGDVCCLDSCDDPLTCTYTENGCGGKYGQMHNCGWDDDYAACTVGL
ncbi:hypothetical protein TL16_g10608 [Triparma laevis f. inornata]|uniref:Uncharacterized protein n=2 Tax=Triparma laevis TaxID=1534972 RepID=A0A9W7FKI3_9STRA|nr:hypothetical protein TL16_g10608 [Triparma laevis f. inornata]GMI13872.1 hypothetical protein TrLO_g9098 [Triparma laevis f. longispina]